jgi:adenylosuccinate synthase
VAGENIGTTLRGIGPCYRDKVGRTFAMRMSDLIRGNLRNRIDEIVAAKRNWLVGLGGGELAGQLDADAIYAMASRWSETLGPLIGDTTNFLLDSLDDNKKLLLEGAQGSLLDIDHGTYPFVTSSNSSGVGVSAGSGVPGRWIEHVIGVAKAYTTRVGGGPFPTELNNELGNKIRDIGREYGTTTGRPRRCGWFDAVAVRYTTRLSGIHGLSLMMLDVLSHFDTIEVCVAYELDGKRITYFPAEADDLRRCRPIYETVEGWKVDVTGVRRWRDLPSQLLKYLDFISELIGVPIEVVSVGPDREQTIFANSTKLSKMLRAGRR